ncbi:helix-turn-helix transcriptional regulator [Pseudochryseolinea flava]|uniref:HTH araC/xylS-type domain-containing protein n=1 Tax=Pseudochryseolinea flava TaxID=2059302 RepID=A0A364Y894_9BACT|nr:helix-turn-helix domain-containing protein [Pseudochryseolinea flava]RAW02354.1 hypothetical protein DQQ10_07420 [Pseudochryseolinea flava]
MYVDRLKGLIRQSLFLLQATGKFSIHKGNETHLNIVRAPTKQNTVTMNARHVREHLEVSIGKMLTNLEGGEITQENALGKFSCSVEDHDQYIILKRDFETYDGEMAIPFSRQQPSLQMIFSINGQSSFNRSSSPFILSPKSHSLSFFNRFECKNLLQKGTRQQDITFGLSKSFYANFVANYLGVYDRLSSLIMQEQEFNTINEHIAIDAAIEGILNNILSCPFQGEMKSVFMREHIRALLALQFFHFNQVVGDRSISFDTRITKRDHDTLHDIKDYIDQNFLVPSSIEMLSKRFGINEFKLKHGFKVLFDTSPMRYLQYRRLTFSRSLLSDTDKTIKEIAHEVGYAHPANFTIAFTKTFGNGPLSFRGKV